MTNYEMVKKVKNDFLENRLDNPDDVCDYVSSINPHDGAKYRRCAVIIAVMGMTECYDGETRFFMPATSDVLRISKSRYIKKLIKRVVGA